MQLSALLMLIIAASPTASAASCQDIINTCDHLIRTSDELIDSLRNTIVAQDVLAKADEALIKQLEGEVARQRAAAAVWYRKPEIVGPLGLTAGVIIGILLVK